MNKNNALRMRKPIAAALFAVGAGAFCIALFIGSRPDTIAGWTPVNESLEEAIGSLASPSENGNQILGTAGQSGSSGDEDQGQGAGGQTQSSTGDAATFKTDADSNSDANTAGTSPLSEPSGESGEPPANPSGVLDLNGATEADLDALPGIGPSKAKAIVAHRDKIGGFRRVEQLLDVKGIGPKVFERLSDLVYVAPRK